MRRDSRSRARRSRPRAGLCAGSNARESRCARSCRARTRSRRGATRTECSTSSARSPPGGSSSIAGPRTASAWGSSTRRSSLATWSTRTRSPCRASRLRWSRHRARADSWPISSARRERIGRCGRGGPPAAPSRRPSPLPTAEARLALLHVGAQAFLRVVALEELLLQLALDRERLLERDLAPALHRALDAPHGLRGAVRRAELLGVLLDLLQELVVRAGLPDLVDDPQVLRALEVEGFSCGHQLDRGRLVDEPRQALRAACAREHSGRHLGQP